MKRLVVALLLLLSLPGFSSSTPRQLTIDGNKISLTIDDASGAIHAVAKENGYAFPKRRTRPCGVFYFSLICSMCIDDIITELSTNLSSYNITLYPPASETELSAFERKLYCQLPDDFKTLYLFCNGFESTEDMFRIVPLDEISDRLAENKPFSFTFAEYLIYCDLWDIEVNPLKPNEYRVSNTGEVHRMLTRSISEFLNRFLKGGVFNSGGLYAWHEEIDRQNKT